MAQKADPSRSGGYNANSSANIKSLSVPRLSVSASTDQWALTQRRLCLHKIPPIHMDFVHNNAKHTLMCKYTPQ